MRLCQHRDDVNDEWAAECLKLKDQLRRVQRRYSRLLWRSAVAPVAALTDARATHATERAALEAAHAKALADERSAHARETEALRAEAARAADEQRQARTAAREREQREQRRRKQLVAETLSKARADGSGTRAPAGGAAARTADTRYAIARARATLRCRVRFALLSRVAAARATSGTRLSSRGGARGRPS